MEQNAINNDVKEQPLDQVAKVNDTSSNVPFADRERENTQSTRTGEETCPHCGTERESVTNGSETLRFVYALGRIEIRFPSLAVEKEFAQATGRAETTWLSNQQALHEVLSERKNRYLVRQLCWVFTIEGLEAYILRPRDPNDLELLVEALRPVPSQVDLDIVIGLRGPIAPPEVCNGLTIPIVIFDQIYSFDIDSLIKSIPRPKGATPKQFGPIAEELFMRIMQMADNAGATDEHRTLNYCAVRYPAIYAITAELFGRNYSLSSVDVRPSPLSGIRKIVDVVLSYTHRQTDVTEKYFCRIDITEEFPFLVTKMSPYYDR